MEKWSGDCCLGRKTEEGIEIDLLARVKPKLQTSAFHRAVLIRCLVD